MPSRKRCWLMKSEPSEFSIGDLQRLGRTRWEGVRNYQARNFMRDDMQVGDDVLFYHSSADPTGVAGLARVSQAACPDPSSWTPGDPYFDARSTPERPRWWVVEIEFVEAFPRVVSLAELRAMPTLAGLQVLKPGQRLSVQPVDRSHYRIIARRGRSAPG
jgi:predicted RNA-binding protein with PUA-like domain